MLYYQVNLRRGNFDFSGKHRSQPGQLLWNEAKLLQVSLNYQTELGKGNWPTNDCGLGLRRAISQLSFWLVSHLFV